MCMASLVAFTEAEWLTRPTESVLRQGNAYLSAHQCLDHYDGERGHLRCREIDRRDAEIKELRARMVIAEKLLLRFKKRYEPWRG